MSLKLILSLLGCVDGFAGGSAAIQDIEKKITDQSYDRAELARMDINNDHFLNASEVYYSYDDYRKNLICALGENRNDFKQILGNFSSNVGEVCKAKAADDT